MKITTTEYGGGRQSLEEFAEKHDLTLELFERPGKPDSVYRWMASFRNVELKGDCVLIGSSGNGNTTDQAIANYVTELRGKKIVVDAFRPERREIEVPNELYYEPKEQPAK